jgi:hypothetical protein
MGKSSRGFSMRYGFVFAIAAGLLFAGSDGFAQQASTSAPTNADFWVAHWAHPKLILYGPEEEDL